MIDWSVLALHILPSVVTGFGVAWWAGRRSAEHDAMWEWYKRTHNGHQDDE